MNKKKQKNAGLKKPTFSGELWRLTYDPREEDDPTFHPDHQALTRLTGLTIPVICIQGDFYSAVYRVNIKAYCSM